MNIYINFTFFFIVKSAIKNLIKALNAIHFIFLPRNNVEEYQNLLKKYHLRLFKKNS